MTNTIKMPITTKALHNILIGVSAFLIIASFTIIKEPFHSIGIVGIIFFVVLGLFKIILYVDENNISFEWKDEEDKK